MVITRPSSTPKEFPEGVKHLAQELTDVSTLAAAFQEHNVEVVISTLAREGLAAQFPAADAAKAAGVKLFVPSEYGVRGEAPTVGPLVAKSKLISKRCACSLNWRRF